jgi:hypothetical protein
MRYAAEARGEKSYGNWQAPSLLGPSGSCQVIPGSGSGSESCQAIPDLDPATNPSVKQGHVRKDKFWVCINGFSKSFRNNPNTAFIFFISFAGTFLIP